MNDLPNALASHFAIADPIKVWLFPEPSNECQRGLLIETSRVGLFVEVAQGVVFVPWTSVQFVQHDTDTEA